MVLVADHISPAGVGNEQSGGYRYQSDYLDAVRKRYGQTPFASMQTLSADFARIDPVDFRVTLAKHRFQIVRESHRALPARKAFWMRLFTRAC